MAGATPASLHVTSPSSPGKSPRPPLTEAVPVNVDSAIESDLKRASTEDIKQFTQGGFFHNAGDSDWVESLKNRRTDWSEMGWIFLIVLVVLILEQAMAVRLSYHTRGNEELQQMSPTIAAAMRIGATTHKTGEPT